MSRGEFGEAHAIYKQGLEQGVDAREERAHIEAQLGRAQASLRQRAIQEAMGEIETGNLERAVQIFELGAWGDEALMDRSTRLVQQRLNAHLRQREPMDEALFVRVLGYEMMRDAGEPVAREVLEAELDSLSDSTRAPTSRIKTLERLVAHPAWRVSPEVTAALTPVLLERGESLVRGLDPLNSDRDFEAASMIHEAQAFGHAPWYEANLVRLSSAVEARRAQIEELAATQGHLATIDALAALHKKFPMTAEQARKNQALFDSLMASHAAPLLEQAREKKSLGQPAQAHVYAALAHYYGASLPSELNLSRNQAKFVGKAPDVVQVIVEYDYEFVGNCQKPAHDKEPVVIGPDAARRKERAVVKTYYSCTKTVTYNEVRTITPGFEWKEDKTRISEYDYCQNSLTNKQRAQCYRSFDGMSQTEKEDRLTIDNSERVRVYDEKVEVVTETTFESSWHVSASFRGNSYRVGQGNSKDDASSITNTHQNSRFEAVRGILLAVDAENATKINEARRQTRERLVRGREAGDLDEQLAAAMRLAWLPSTKDIELDKLSEEDAKLFVLGGESLDVATSALARKRRGLPTGRTIASPSSTLSFEAVPLVSAVPEPQPYEVRYDGPEVSVAAWQSTGLEQHIDYGALGEAPGSSLVELGLSVARVPLVDVQLATSIDPKITLKHTSLGASLYLDPPGISGARGFSLGLRRALVRAGAFNDPKLTSFVGLSYTQLARSLEPDVRRPAEEGDDTRTAQPREELVALYRQGAGYRFLGAELGTNIPMGLKMGAELGAHLNVLSVVDLFEDAESGEYNPMSQGYMGLTWSAGAWFVHGRASYWFGAPEQLSPVGGQIKVGIRL